MFPQSYCLPHGKGSPLRHEHSPSSAVTRQHVWDCHVPCKHCVGSGEIGGRSCGSGFPRLLSEPSTKAPHTPPGRGAHPGVKFSACSQALTSSGLELSRSIGA